MDARYLPERWYVTARQTDRNINRQVNMREKIDDKLTLFYVACSFTLLSQKK